MRLALRCVLVLTLVVMATPAMAGKIGFVDAEKAVATVQEGQAKFRELREWAEPRQQLIEGLVNRIRELQSQMSQQATVASREALERLQQEELEVRRQAEDASREFQRELDAKQTELLRDVAIKVNVVTSDYAKANDYDAVLILKPQMLIYLADSADLTDTVIKSYDERFPLRD